MGDLNKLFFVIPALVLFMIPMAYADNSIDVVRGSGVPGCEEITNGCYSPDVLAINVGETVTWNNIDSAAHTVTSGTQSDGPSGEFDSSLFMSGNTFSTTFDHSGNYPYFCMVHPWMTGQVIVGDGGIIIPTPIPTPQPTTDDELEIENKKLRNENTNLKNEVGQLKAENKKLTNNNNFLTQQIADLQEDFDNQYQIILEQLKIIYEFVVSK